MKVGQLVVAGLIAAFVAVRWRRLSWEGRIGLVLVAAGMTVSGTGLVKLPNFEKLIVDLGESLGHWTYLFVGAMAFAETGAFLGFIAPGEFTVIVGGVVAGQGRIDVVALIAIVWAACLLGDGVSFALGRRLGRGFLVKHGARVRITPERLDKVEDFFRRRGGVAILVGRFIGFVRPISPFLAGSSGMPFRRFIPYDLLAAGVWSTAFVLLGYVFWQSFHRVADIAKKGAFALGAAVALGFGIAWLVRHREEVRDRVLATRAGRAVARPVGFAWNRLTPGDLGLELTTLLAVAGVGAFAFIGYGVVLQDVSTTPGDLRAFDIARDLRGSVGLDVARAVTWLGAPPVAWTAVVLAAVWLAARDRPLEAGVLVSGVVLTAVAVHLAKVGFDRPRPADPLVSRAGSSFPSGHAAYAMGWVAAAVATSRAARILRQVGVVLIAVVIAVVVALSRVYLRAHYLSDVLGGAGLAAAIYALCGVTALIVAYVRQNGTAS